MVMMVAASKRVMSAESIRVMRPLFQAGEGGSIPTSALHLWIEPIEFGLAQALNAYWHSRMPGFGTGSVKSKTNKRFTCYGAVYEGKLYAVAIWSAPGGREIPRRYYELRRFAIAPDAPRNTGSRMLRIMTLLIYRNPQLAHVARLISFQDLGFHTGSIYAGAGWKKAPFVSKGHEWDCKSRPRPAAQSAEDKQRWDKRLREE